MTQVYTGGVRAVELPRDVRVRSEEPPTEFVADAGTGHATDADASATVDLQTAAEARNRHAHDLGAARRRAATEAQFDRGTPGTNLTQATIEEFPEEGRIRVTGQIGGQDAEFDLAQVLQHFMGIMPPGMDVIEIDAWHRDPAGGRTRIRARAERDPDTGKWKLIHRDVGRRTVDA